MGHMAEDSVEILYALLHWYHDNDNAINLYHRLHVCGTYIK